MTPPINSRFSRLTFPTLINKASGLLLSCHQPKDTWLIGWPRDRWLLKFKSIQLKFKIQVPVALCEFQVPGATSPRASGSSRASPPLGGIGGVEPVGILGARGRAGGHFCLNGSPVPSDRNKTGTEGALPYLRGQHYSDT